MGRTNTTIFPTLGGRAILSFRIACGGELLMDFDDPSRIHAAEVIVWLPLGHAPRAGGWHGHQSALAGPAGCGALGEERWACTNSAARLCSSTAVLYSLTRFMDLLPLENDSLKKDSFDDCPHMGAGVERRRPAANWFHRERSAAGGASHC